MGFLSKMKKTVGDDPWASMSNEQLESLAQRKSGLFKTVGAKARSVLDERKAKESQQTGVVYTSSPVKKERMNIFGN